MFINAGETCREGVFRCFGFKQTRLAHFSVVSLSLFLLSSVCVCVCILKDLLKFTIPVDLTPGSGELLLPQAIINKTPNISAVDHTGFSTMGPFVCINLTINVAYFKSFELLCVFLPASVHPHSETLTKPSTRRKQTPSLCWSLQRRATAASWPSSAER